MNYEVKFISRAIQWCNGSGQWHRKQFESRGAQSPEIFFTVPLHFFVVPPREGTEGKCRGTVTRTEIGQRWPTVWGQSDLWPFKVMLCQSWSRQPIVLGLFHIHVGSLMTPTSYYAAFLRYCMQILERTFGLFRGPRFSLVQFNNVYSASTNF